MTGSVNNRLEPQVRLRIRNPYIPDREADCPFLVDTGYEWVLKIDPYLQQQLGLFRSFVTRVRLADGSVAAMDLCLVEFFWMGRWRRELAHVGEGGHLIGMRALAGSTLTIHAVPGGTVSVE